jgi:hypothetical protein
MLFSSHQKKANYYQLISGGNRTVVEKIWAQEHAGMQVV